MIEIIFESLRWGSIQAGVVFFQCHFLTGVLLVFYRGRVVFKSGVAFKRIQYAKCLQFQAELFDLKVHFHFRTVALHPLAKIDGCKCIRYTYSNDGPV